MKIHQITQIGSFHTNHCEDATFFAEISDNQIAISVMDGCTMGTESHFAVAIAVKLLRKITKQQAFRNFAERKEYPNSTLLKNVMQEFWVELKRCQTTLQLSTYELLFTMIIGIINQDHKTGTFLVVGDGMIGVDYQYYEYEQNNQPNYLAYHLREPFLNWYATQQFLNIETFNDLSIATDGIFSFQSKKLDTTPHNGADFYLNWLCKDLKGWGNARFFEGKLRHLKLDSKVVPTDDLGIIRLRF